MKKWFSGLIIGMILLLIFAVVYIEFNKQKIITAIVQNVNTNLTTPIEYQSGDVSLFKNFPKISASFHDVRIADNRFEKPLIDVGTIRTDINLRGIAGNLENIKIDKLKIHDGTIHIITDKKGYNNYQISKESQSDDETASQSVVDRQITIKSFEAHQINVYYIDHQNASYYQAENSNIDGHIALSSEQIDLDLLLGSDLSALSIGVPIRLEASLPVSISQDFGKISSSQAQLSLNDLGLSLDFDITNRENLDYQVNFSSSRREVKSLLSLIPQVYNNHYTKAISSGQFVLKGSVQGSSSISYPQYEMDLLVENGKLSYPDLSEQLDNVYIDLKSINRGGSHPFDEIHINGLQADIGDSEVRGSLLIDQRAKSYDIAADMNLDIDMNDVKNAFHWKDISKLTGRSKASITGQLNANDQLGIANLDNFHIEGSLDDFHLSKINGEEILIKKIVAIGDQHKLQIHSDELNFPDIHIPTASVAVEEIIDVLLSNKIIKGKAAINISRLLASTDTISVPSNHYYQIPSLDMLVDLQIDTAIYNSYHIHNLQAKGRITDKESNIDYSVQSINDNMLSGTAVVNNMIQYGLSNDTLTGTATISSNRLDLNSFMSDNESLIDSTEAIVPGNLDLQVDCQIEQLIYNQITMNNVSGPMHIADHHIDFDNRADLFGGQIKFNGQFDGLSSVSPALDINMDFEKFSFEETAKNLSFFKQFIPIADYLRGEYNGTLKWNSVLDNDYWPDIYTLSSFGEIKTLGGSIENFISIDEFFKQYGRQLQSIDRWEMDDLNRYFEIENGKVIIPRSTFRHKNISIIAAGSHSFDQQLNYETTISVPKKYIQLDKIYSELTQKLDMPDELAQLTDDVIIQLVVHINGHILSPKFKILDLKLKKGTVVESVKEAAIEKVKDTKDQAEQTIRDTIRHYEDMVKDTINAITEKVSDKIEETKAEVDSQLQVEKEAINDDITALVDSIKSGNLDSLDRTIEDILNERKSKIEELKTKIKLPFGKKKTTDNDN